MLLLKGRLGWIYASGEAASYTASQSWACVLSAWNEDKQVIFSLESEQNKITLCAQAANPELSMLASL